MKKIALLLSLLCLAAHLRAQNIEGQIVASQYGNWKIPGLTPDSYAFPPTSCRVQGGASYFDAFAVGTPIKIVDGNPGLSEIVTPSAVTQNNQDCAVSIAPANSHQVPFSLTSGTGGLQEAINQNLTTPNSVVLDSAWRQLVGSANVSAVIAAAKGSSTLNLVDVTTAPYNFYAWNGTSYVLVASGGGGGGSLSSVGLSMPSWFSVLNSPLLANGSFSVVPAQAQTSHMVIGTCGTSTTFGPCALQAGDTPGITAITGDVMASGAGSVAGTVRGLNGVPLSGINGLLQDNAGSVVQASAINLPGNGQFGGYVAAGTYIVPFSTSPVFDLSQGNLLTLTLTGDVTSSSVSNLPSIIDDVRHVTIRVCQDSVGYHNYPDPTWANGWNSPTLAPGQCTDTLYTVSSTGLVVDGYNAAFCAVSGASPLACGHATRGYGTIPAGTNPVATVNTTAIGPMSIVDVRYATAIGASVSPAVTCDPTVGQVYWTATGTVSSTSFGVAAAGTFSNPVCFTFVVINP